VTADEAQAEALESRFALPGGGAIFVEVTRALTAVDVDAGDRAGDTAKRLTRAANLAALAEAARVLRLKGLGGLTAIDLVGRGHDAPGILAAARQVFAADNPGVVIAPVSRFGVIELAIPRRARPAVEILAGADGAVTSLTGALNLIRAMEREALAAGGARIEAAAEPAVASASAPYVEALAARFGARLSLRAEPAMAAGAWEVATR
jgi:Ribonuclease G/E